MSRQPSITRRPQSSASKGAIPKQPAKGGKTGTKKTEKAKKGEKTVAEWDIPPLSIPPKKKKPTIDWEKLKKDTLRRQAPQGEDIKEIRRVLKELKGVDIHVHEYINLLSQYTADNGAALRSVMAADLEAFRTLARKVYETMTQDVSDVLINEQLQTVQFYQEKNDCMTEKMMRSINQLYEMAPSFNFEKYLENKERYLSSLFPLPEQAALTDEVLEMQRRQQAYHRLQWLRSEGERMGEENKRLKRRLDELRNEQQVEQNRAVEIAAEAETQRQELAAQESQMKDKLEQLNESIEKQFISEEAKFAKEHNRSVMEKPSQGAIKKKVVAATKKKKKRPQWASDVAADMEEAAVDENVAADIIKAPSASNIRSRSRRPRSPHFSPIKTPPPKPARERSPFHYSPPPSSPQQEAAYGGLPGATMQEDLSEIRSFGRAQPQRTRPPSPFHFSPPKSPPRAPEQETTIQETTTTVQQKRPAPSIRPSMAPRDTWGGFY